MAVGRSLNVAMGHENMEIRVGSTNKQKIEAVKETLQDYPHLKDALISSANISSGVKDQPTSLEETIRGGMNRARNAFNDCTYSIGLESGLINVPYTKTGYMDVCVCAIFDGKDFHLGLSSAWEPPREVVRYMISEGLDMNQATLKAGLTSNPVLGSAEGLIGIMTKGRTTRKGYTQEALRNALIHLE